MKKIVHRQVAKKWIKRLGLGILPLIIGGIWQNVMQEKESQLFPPPGKIISVQSHDMHLYGTGTGKSTFVFIPGSGTPNAFTDFYYLQKELQSYARTVSYDRAGYGWSAKTTNPRTIDTVTEELHELLEKANEPGPYLLAAHSLGSLEALRFAQKYPDEVKGIVLLDGGSPEYYANDSEAKSYVLNRMMAGLRVTGLVRALGTVGILLPFSGENLRYPLLPDEMKEMDASMYYNHLGDASNLSFIAHINENAQAVVEGGYLHDIPLLILSSDGDQEWGEVQQQLLHWSNNSTQETIPASQHYIHWSHKEIIASKLVEMLRIVEKKSHGIPFDS